MDGKRFSWARRAVVLSAAAVAVAGSYGAANAAAGAPAPGLRLTVDGPALGGPVRFVVPPGTERLKPHIDDLAFTLMFRPKQGVMSEDGKHRLNTVLLRTAPGRAGEFTQDSGIETMTVDLDAHVDTPQSQGMSMSFRHKGQRHPARVQLQRYDEKARPAVAAGQFSGRLQRTNNKHTHEFYQVDADFHFGK